MSSNYLLNYDHRNVLLESQKRGVSYVDLLMNGQGDIGLSHESHKRELLLLDGYYWHEKEELAKIDASKRIFKEVLRLSNLGHDFVFTWSTNIKESLGLVSGIDLNSSTQFSDFNYLTSQFHNATPKYYANIIRDLKLTKNENTEKGEFFAKLPASSLKLIVELYELSLFADRHSQWNINFSLWTAFNKVDIYYSSKLIDYDSLSPLKTQIDLRYPAAIKLAIECVRAKSLQKG